jgi:hypothetical protein
MDNDEIIEFLLWALATAPPDAKATRHDRAKLFAHRLSTES